jgi:hypothetical protein
MVDWIVTMLQIRVNMLHRTGEYAIIIGKNRHTPYRYVSTCKFGQMIFAGPVVYLLHLSKMYAIILYKNQMFLLIGE